MEAFVDLHLCWQLQSVGIGVHSLDYWKGPDSLVIQLLRFPLGFDVPCRKPHFLADLELDSFALSIPSLPSLSFQDMLSKLLVYAV